MLKNDANVREPIDNLKRRIDRVVEKVQAILASDEIKNGQIAIIGHAEMFKEMIGEDLDYCDIECLDPYIRKVVKK